MCFSNITRFPRLVARSAVWRRASCTDGNSRRGFRRAGVSLVELLVAVSLSSVLFVAIGGTVAVAVMSLPHPSDGAVAHLDSAVSLQDLADELRFATSVTESSATLIEFTVPDRDGDGNDEVIRYEWSGTPGDPLIRQYNGGAAHNHVESVQGFALSYVVDFAGEVQSAEQLFILEDQTGFSAGGFANIGVGDMAAATFMPTLPAGTLRWEITKVELYLCKSGNSNGVNAVELTEVAADGSPDETRVIQSVQVLESELPDDFYPVAITAAGDLDPTLGKAVVVRPVSGNGTTVKLNYGTSGSANPNTAAWEHFQGAWSPLATRRYFLKVYGTYTAPGNVVSYVDVSLTYGPDAAEDIARQSVPLLNRPAQ